MSFYFEYKKISDFVSCDDLVDNLTKVVGVELIPPEGINYLIYDSCGWRVSSKRPIRYEDSRCGPYAVAGTNIKFIRICDKQDPYKSEYIGIMNTELVRNLEYISKICTEKRIYVIGLNDNENNISLSEKIKANLLEADSTIEQLKRDNEILQNKINVNSAEIASLQIIKDRLEGINW